MKGKALILPLIAAVCMTCSAYAAELEIENGGMDYGKDLYRAEVHHSGGEVRPITVQVKNSKSQAVGYFSEFLTDKAGNLSLAIPMNSAKNPSGEYIIRLSGADITQPCEVTVVCVNQSDAEDIISAIKNNPSDLADRIRANIYSVGLETPVKTMWDNIGRSGQDTVVSAVAGKSFSDAGGVRDAFTFSPLSTTTRSSSISTVCQSAYSSSTAR